MKTVVRRERAMRLDPFGPSRRDGRRDHLDLLAPEHPALARMRVQARHGDPRPPPQRGLQGAIGDAQGLQHAFQRHRLYRFAQRHVNADQHGAQLVVGQHHAHRHLLQGHAGVSRGFGLQQLGVARVRQAGGSQGLLVQRRSDQAGDLAA